MKVGAFGLAKEVTASSSGVCVPAASAASSGDLTQTGTVMGPPLYMAPEQDDPRWNEDAANNDLAAAADPYAFCVALWEGLHGAPPFSGAMIEGKKIAGPPVWPPCAVPQAVADAVVRGLAAKPEQRWTDLEELLRELDVDGGRRGSRFGGLALVAAAGVGVAASAWLWDSSEEPCQGVRVQLAKIWDAGARARLDAVLRQAGPKFAADVADKTDLDFSRIPVVGFMPACWSQDDIPAYGTFSLQMDLSAGPQASPPSASITMPSAVSCPGSVSLTASVSDPDAELDPQRWYVDDVLLSSSITTLPMNEDQTIRVVATDARGAATTATHTISCQSPAFSPCVWSVGSL